MPPLRPFPGPQYCQLRLRGGAFIHSFRPGAHIYTDVFLLHVYLKFAWSDPRATDPSSQGSQRSLSHTHSHEMSSSSAASHQDALNRSVAPSSGNQRLLSAQTSAKGGTQGRTLVVKGFVSAQLLGFLPAGLWDELDELFLEPRLTLTPADATQGAACTLKGRFEFPLVGARLHSTCAPGVWQFAANHFWWTLWRPS